ncbi:hypothetical protein L0F63_005920 [Massospora cicadina]|nr:hypothetical protein L0F63_005920 [Massospora cicadina]
MPDDLFISESPDQTYEAELSPQAQFQPMAIQNLLIPTHQHHRPPVNTSAFMSATHPHPENFNPVVLSTLLSSGRYSSASLFFGRGLSQPEGGRSPELESLVSPTRPHTRSALFLSQLQSASSARFSQTSSVSRHFDSRVAFTPHDAASRTQGSRARDESRANYGMPRLVALGGNEEQDEEISPWLDYYESNVGETVAPRLPSLSPFNLEARLAQSFLEPPLSGDASPSTLPASDFASRSPTSRRLRTNQLDAVTQRYLRQLKEGCAKLACQNVFCAAHPSFIPRDDKEATTLALTLSQYGEEFICLDVPEFDPDTAALPGPLKNPSGTGLRGPPLKATAILGQGSF